MKQAVLDQLATNADAALERLIDLLKIPSVGTDPAFDPHTRAAAEWVREHLDASGLDAKVMPTGGQPVVVAHTRPEQVANPDAPRVLFYGHYDVQPPDPLEKWSSPPFMPEVRDGKLYARGANDDKGQIMTFMEALRGYHDAGEKLPGPVTVLIEGEEECGGENLPPFIENHQELLAADVCVVSDTSMYSPTRMAITYALRGLVYYDVKLHGPSRDLHSGVYGGSLANPATVLARALGKLMDDENRIAIPGFYDDVAPLTPEERARWDELGYEDDEFLGEVDAEPFGEAGFDSLERRWARPSCDVNGLYGGYMGEGAKTVIPAFAGAKVSFRIPPNMDPTKVARQFEAFLQGLNVGDCRWELTNLGNAWPVMTPIDSPFMQAAVEACAAQFGSPPALVREGATIPIIAEFGRILGIETLLVGLGLHGDNLHAPDEHFGLDRYELGKRVHADLLARIAGSGA